MSGAGQATSASAGIQDIQDRGLGLTLRSAAQALVHNGHVSVEHHVPGLSNPIAILVEDHSVIVIEQDVFSIELRSPRVQIGRTGDVV